MFEGTLPDMDLQESYVTDGYLGRSNRSFPNSRAVRTRIIGQSTEGTTGQMQWNVSSANGSILHVGNSSGMRRTTRANDISPHPLLVAEIESSATAPENSQQRRDLGAIIRVKIFNFSKIH